ncbi:hypothetical protein Tco_1160753, partial [Tanacetum coccineum]
AELDRSNELIAKYMTEYEQAKADLSLEEKMELITELIKTENKRVKRPGIQLAQESSKRLKTTKASGSEPSQEQQTKDPKELSEEELKKMMEI